MIKQTNRDYRVRKKGLSRFFQNFNFNRILGKNNLKCDKNKFKKSPVVCHSSAVQIILCCITGVQPKNVSLNQEYFINIWYFLPLSFPTFPGPLLPSLFPPYLTLNFLHSPFSTYIPSSFPPLPSPFLFPTLTSLFLNPFYSFPFLSLSYPSLPFRLLMFVHIIRSR